MTISDVLINKKAVIFDLDGTIVKTNGLWNEATKQIAIQNSMTADLDGLSKLIGVSVTTKWKTYTQSFYPESKKNIKELVDETHDKFLEILNKTQLEPVGGFWRVLYKFKEELGWKTALCTSTHKEIAQKILEKINAENVFDVYVYGNECRKNKPNPDIYYKTLRNLGVKASETVVFEDSPAGAEASTRAKIDTIVVFEDIEKYLYPSGVVDYISNFEDTLPYINKSPRDVIMDHINYMDAKFNPQDYQDQ